ncbi:protein of unknown function (plasmid) [Cupriavidus taiwanensis]|uniref:Uncharacterized protein n=1 Tax=Cupriavidus taiwanensis TaxID=164546 RepID=A0A375IN54_9BURK|nr:protein of unknown function [Cupriavidus taiwanensis]
MPTFMSEDATYLQAGRGQRDEAKRGGEFSDSCGGQWATWDARMVSDSRRAKFSRIDMRAAPGRCSCRHRRRDRALSQQGEAIAASTEEGRRDKVELLIHAGDGQIV